jgi:hypothetical protein
MHNGMNHVYINYCWQETPENIGDPDAPESTAEVDI